MRRRQRLLCASLPLILSAPHLSSPFLGREKVNRAKFLKTPLRAVVGKCQRKKKKNKKNGTNAAVNSARVRKVQDVLISLHTHARKNTWRSLFVALAPSPLLLRQMECNSEKSMSETLVGGRVQRAQMGVR